MSAYATRPIKWAAGAAKLLVWDIEMMSHDFNPSMGEILCVAFQHPLWTEPRVVRYDDFPGALDLDITQRDKYLCAWLSEHFADAEILVGHYAYGFDRPVVNARIMHHGFDPFVMSQDIDTYRIAKKNFNPGKRFGNSGLSCSLANLAKFFGLEQQKGGISKDDWRRVMTNDYPHIVHEIAQYCKQDVRTTLDLFNLFRKLPGIQVNLALADGRVGLACTNCGSSDLQSRGTRTTTTQQYQRFRCNDCGKWMRGRTTLLNRNDKRLMPL